jgi:choline dehydrogenase-like flavoprotein
MIDPNPDWSDGTTIETDLCIVGAGVVGLSLAQTFIGAGLKVLVLEGGGWKPTVRGQDDLWAERAGMTNHAFGFSRFRCYGGTGGHWAGLCPRPEPHDLDGTGGRPTWPVTLQELEPWFKRAETLLAVPHPANDPAAWEKRIGRAPDLGAALRSVILPIAQRHDPGRDLRAQFETDSDVRIALGSDVTEIEVDDDGRRVTALRVALQDGRRVRVRSRITVLAGGGVENARLLLLSDARLRGGIGNAYDQVGRVFMDHLYCYAGHLEPAAETMECGPHIVKRFADLAGDAGAIAAYALSERTLRDEGLNGAAAFFMHRAAFQLTPDYDGPGGQAVTHFAEILRGERYPDRETAAMVGAVFRHAPSVLRLVLGYAAHILRPQTRIALRMQIEASPRSDSRVTLAAARDRLGRRRARVDWQIDPEDGRGAARLWRSLEAGLRDAGVGRLIGTPPGENGIWPAATSGGKHHMGTTRMSMEPSKGVVDRECRVHGMENLFIAGASVFPTGSWANPTLTAVALALRLADRLTR